MGATASGNGFSASASATYVVDNPTPTSTTNRAPVAVDDLVRLTTVQAVKIAVLTNDYDPEGSALRVVSATRPSKGTVTVNSDGTVTYVPGKRFRTKDTFSYTITDGTSSATAYVSVTR